MEEWLKRVVVRDCGSWLYILGEEGLLSSWEEEGWTVVVMGVLVMRFADVKDLREFSATEHHLVYVNFSLMNGHVLGLYEAALIL